MLTEDLVRDAEARLLARIDGTVAEVGMGFPHAADGRIGGWEVKPDGSWTGGFWVGCCWLAHALTGEPRYRTWGLEWAQRLRGRERDLTHDIGFLFQYAAVLGWQTVGEPALRALALAAADQLLAMWLPRARVIPVGTRADVSAGTDDVTIDCLMNLQVLWWAAWETGGARYREVALAHAERTAAWHVRPDGSCVQSVHFDPETGDPVKKHTHQGYSPEGTWSRGLGWCAYGFLEAYRATGRPEFLQIARNAAEYHLRRMPDDGVPFYDYDDPRIPGVSRDTSAAAILASACLGLAEVEGNSRFREAAGGILESLIRGYLTPLGPDDRRPPGMLLHGCYNLHTGEAPDHELIWGDYFLLEALARWQGRSPRIWGPPRGAAYPGPRADDEENCN
ncbi:MAG: glycoside hydrolase family 88 protein [Gemmatimonadota bacterium]